MADPRPTLKLVDIDEKLQEPTTQRGQLAAAVREGRRREKQDQASERTKLAGQHQGEITGLKQAHVDELERHDARWTREEAKHGAARFWSGVSVGLFVSGAVVAVGLAFYTNSILGPTFDAASRSRFDAMAVDAITQERPPTTNAPRSESYPRINPREPGDAQ